MPAGKIKSGSWNLDVGSSKTNFLLLRLNFRKENQCNNKTKSGHLMSPEQSGLSWKEIGQCKWHDDDGEGDDDDDGDDDNNEDET